VAVPDPASVKGPPARPVSATRFLNWGTWGAIAVLFVVSVQQTGFNLEVVGQGMGDFLRFFGRLAPDWRALPQIWGPLVETLQIAWLGTVFGTILGLPLIFLASFNTTINPPVISSA
jgi:phosphonate transport system permease protein